MFSGILWFTAFYTVNTKLKNNKELFLMITITGIIRMKKLESDEYFLRADRIEIPASITALSFYQKMGYDFKNGVDYIDEEGLYRLEKFTFSETD